MPYFERPKSKTREMIEELARSHPLKWIVNPDDPMANLPLQPLPVGIAAKSVTGPLIRALFNKAGKILSAERSEIANALRVFASLPKKTKREWAEFRFPHQEFGGHSGVKGSYSALDRDIALIPVKESVEFVSGSTLPGTLAHEAGHLSGDIIAERMGNLRGLYQDRPIREGIAEYLGQKSLQKAGVKEAPLVAYPGQFDIMERIAKMGSKNPYMNVYRFLQQTLERFPK